MSESVRYCNQPYSDECQSMHLWFQKVLFPTMLECEAKVQKQLRCKASKPDKQFRNKKKVSHHCPDIDLLDKPAKIGNQNTQLENLVPSRDETSTEDGGEKDSAMEEFLTKSLQHQRELGPAEDLPRTHHAPNKHPGQVREADMEELYGNGAGTILSLETKLQAQFDRNLLNYHPNYWPVIPLNL
ncbi:unnamed protein product [Clavelina lepadiformis]|uniref:Uncharacterized protein n=1 Tax=Clavelina lepadiformis TaxID=159417 RepID=A0ABP0H2X6_CLALP